MLETILQAVGNVGFPIAVSVYLLVRIEGKLEALAASIAQLAEAVAGERQEVKRQGVVCRREPPGASTGGSLLPPAGSLLTGVIRDTKKLAGVLKKEIGRLTISEEARFIKRATDLLLSLAALVVTAPLNILVSIAIKLDSSGPVLYRQKRLTLQGKSFNLYKFRTMVKNAEQETGPVLATENDPRVTRVGRFLRAARIDELPQLLNVLKGDMSIRGAAPGETFLR